MTAKELANRLDGSETVAGDGTQTSHLPAVKRGALPVELLPGSVLIWSGKKRAGGQFEMKNKIFLSNNRFDNNSKFYNRIIICTGLNILENGFLLPHQFLSGLLRLLLFFSLSEEWRLSKLSQSGLARWIN